VIGLVMWKECDMRRVQGYQKSLIIMNNQLHFYVPICITSYRHNDIYNAATDD